MESINMKYEHLPESEIDKLIVSEPDITIKEYIQLLEEIQAIKESHEDNRDRMPEI